MAIENIELRLVTEELEFGQQCPIQEKPCVRLYSSNFPGGSFANTSGEETDLIVPINFMADWKGGGVDLLTQALKGSSFGPVEIALSGEVSNEFAVFKSFLVEEFRIDDISVWMDANPDNWMVHVSGIASKASITELAFDDENQKFHPSIEYSIPHEK